MKAVLTVNSFRDMTLTIDTRLYCILHHHYFVVGDRGLQGDDHPRVAWSGV